MPSGSYFVVTLAVIVFFILAISDPKTAISNKERRIQPNVAFKV